MQARKHACVSNSTAQAYRLSRAFRAFDFEIAGVSQLQGAIVRCPRGGSILLLLPSISDDVQVTTLSVCDDVHIFGRGIF